VPRVVFAPSLRRHVDTPPQQVDGATVREVLSAVFALQPRIRGYVLDEQGSLRKHVMVFVNGQRIADREGLGDPLAPADEVQVFQALTGG
jgi:molybdopterin synthase sulfur carrier subunit